MVAILSIAVSFLGVIILPMVIMSFRIAIGWKGIEDKIQDVAKDLEKLVHDKDAVHSEIIRQMRDDRQASDRRLRWLEENLWSKRGNSS